MKKNIIISIILIGIISLTTIFANLSNEIKETELKIEEAESRMLEVESQLQSNQLKKQDIVNKISRIEQDIIAVENSIKKLEDEIVVVERNIEHTKKEIEEAEKKLEEKNELLEKRLNAMYRNGEHGYLEILLGSADFTELLTNIDLITKIMDHDLELIEALENQRLLIIEHQKKLEKQESNLIALKNEEDEKREVLVISRNTQVKLRREVEGMIAQMSSELDELDRLSKRLETELEDMYRRQQYVGGRMGWPVPNYYNINSPFGYRIHPILGTNRFHQGIDIPAPMGANVIASNEGTVIMAEWYGGYGNTVIIDHGGQIATLYAHNSRLLVSVGDEVKRGDVIALIGSTGNSTGPHLHFEVRRNGQYENPVDWLQR